MEILNQKQSETKAKIELLAKLFNVPAKWAVAVAMVESSLGTHQKSPTGCKGVFQVSSIAMRDLWESMQKIDDDLVDIVCGLAFLRLLMKRWGIIEKAIEHYCDPADRDFYLSKVKDYMSLLE